MKRIILAIRKMFAKKEHRGVTEWAYKNSPTPSTEYESRYVGKGPEDGLTC